jgi:transcriptional regulator with XRE-family HTH domain
MWISANRKSRGISREKLAEELGVTDRTILNWEQGKTVPKSDKMQAINGYFGEMP